MKFGMKAAILAIAISATSSAATAKTMSVMATLKSYSGNRAYAVVYLVDGNGRYASTLYTAGRKGKYLKHLSRWKRMFSRAGGRVDGSTGASVGSGNGFAVGVNIPDNLIDNGYALRIETAVEDRNYYPQDIEIPLTSANSGKSFAGSGYIDTVTVKY